MCETWKRGSSLDGSGDIFTRTSLRSSGWRWTGSRKQEVGFDHKIPPAGTDIEVCVPREADSSSLTVLYILSWMLLLRPNSLSWPEEERFLAPCVRRRKSLKRKAHSSLVLLVLWRRPLCSSLRGPRQLVSELKTKCCSQRVGGGGAVRVTKSCNV